MRHLGSIAIVFLAAAGFTSFSSARAPALLPGPGAVIAMHESLFRAIDAGKVEEALPFLHDDMNMGENYRARPCSLFLCDQQGQPLTARNHEQSAKLLKDWTLASAGDGKWTTTVTPIGADCFSAELSYAVLEITRTRTVDGKTTTRRYHSTSLVTYGKDGWQLTHWHLSPAEAGAAGATVVR
ncbi:MAG: hypothetical protein U1E76_06915 [Planctomycetota bacterium]